MGESVSMFSVTMSRSYLNPDPLYVVFFAVFDAGFNAGFNVDG